MGGSCGRAQNRQKFRRKAAKIFLFRGGDKDARGLPFPEIHAMIGMLKNWKKDVLKMPFLDVKASCEITPAQELELKTELGRLISLIPGKSEGALMISFTDHCRLWFGGEQETPIAMVKAMIYGSASPESCSAFGDAVVELFQRVLGVKHIYFKLEDGTDWCWN